MGPEQDGAVARRTPPGSTTSPRWPPCSASRRARLEADAVGDHVFGYTLVSDWRAPRRDGAPVEHADGVPIAIGPCVVTADELDPQTMFVTVKVDDQDLRRAT